MAEIKGLMFGLIIASFFIVVGVLGLTHGVTTYGGSINESQLEQYNKFNELANLSADIRAQGNEEQTNSIVDILGDFFKTGYKSVKLTEKSIDITTEMANDGIANADLGESGKSFSGMVTLLIILAVVFVILAILVGKEL